MSEMTKILLSRNRSNDDDVSVSSSISGVSAAPSALRQGKYSTYPYAPQRKVSNHNSFGSKNYKSGKKNTTFHFENEPSELSFSDTSAISTGGKRSSRSSHRHRNGGKRKTHNSPVSVADFPDEPPLPLVEPSGVIMSRCSSRSLLLKRWKEMFWTKYGPSSILIFRSKSDFTEWEALQNERKDDELNKMRKKELVKLCIDFDTVAALKKARKEILLNPSAESAGQMKVIKYGVMQVKVKKYNGVELHNFKIDRWTDAGPGTAAAFASPHTDELKPLRDAIFACMEYCARKYSQKNRKSRKKHGKSRVTPDDTSIASSQSDISSYSRNSHMSSNSKASRGGLKKHQLRSIETDENSDDESQISGFSALGRRKRRGRKQLSALSGTSGFGSVTSKKERSDRRKRG